jgi:hypothetical protein
MNLQLQSAEIHALDPHPILHDREDRFGGRRMSGLPRSWDASGLGSGFRRKTSIGLTVATIRTAGVLLLLLLGSGQALLAQSTSRAFAIPSSDLVFDGTLSLSSGATVKFSAREGSFVLIDSSPDDSSGTQLGIVLTMDRTVQLGETAKRVVVHTWRIEPNPAGGDTASRLGIAAAKYGEAVSVGSGGEAMQVTVHSDHFEDFKDGLLVTALWKAVRKDSNALDGLYDELYTLYGPTAQTCIICEGVLVCGTDVVCPGGGFSY